MPHLIFTLDFHQLVRGELQPGSVAMIEYDPLRLVPSESTYKHGDPAFHFAANLKYLPTLQEDKIILGSQTGILEMPVVELDGGGSMLTGNFTVPDNVEEITVWFELTTPAGKVYRDPGNTDPYSFRFIKKDIEVLQAVVINNTNKPTAILKIELLAIKEVTEIAVRYRRVNSAEATVENLLAMKGDSDDGKNKWISGDVHIPFKSVIAFDIQYFVGAQKYKMDNNGNYYICQQIINEKQEVP